MAFTEEEELSLACSTTYMKEGRKAGRVGRVGRLDGRTVGRQDGRTAGRLDGRTAGR
jgi:hypothetical protein